MQLMLIETLNLWNSIGRNEFGKQEISCGKYYERMPRTHIMLSFDSHKYNAWTCLENFHDMLDVYTNIVKLQIRQNDNSF